MCFFGSRTDKVAGTLRVPSAKMTTLRHTECAYYYKKMTGWKPVLRTR